MTQTKQDIVDLPGAWLRGTLSRKLDIQCRLFGASLAFYKESGFLNTQNHFLMEQVNKFFADTAEDTSGPDAFAGAGPETEEAEESIGASDGV